MKFRGLYFFGIVTLVAGLIFSISQATSQKESDSSQTPTPIQVNVMTSAQREHSKVHNKYQTGRRLDIPSPAIKAGSEEGVYVEAPLEIVSDNAPVITFNDFLKDLACKSDAIIIAGYKSHISQLTENREFIFTDYTMRVEEVFKSNPEINITSGNEITVTRPGGSILIQGRTVRALDSSFRPITSRAQYLLFLKHIGKTGAYETLGKGSFLIKNGVLVPLTEQYIPSDTGEERTFSSGVRQVLTSACNR